MTDRLKINIINSLFNINNEYLLEKILNNINNNICIENKYNNIINNIKRKLSNIDYIKNNDELLNLTNNINILKINNNSIIITLDILKISINYYIDDVYCKRRQVEECTDFCIEIKDNTIVDLHKSILIIENKKLYNNFNLICNKIKFKPIYDVLNLTQTSEDDLYKYISLLYDYNNWF